MSRRRLAVLGVVILCLAAAIFVGYILLPTRDALTAGAAAMRQAATEMHAGRGRVSAGTLVARTRQDVTRARDDFRRADDRLTPLAPVLRRLGWVPGVGEEMSLTPDVARVADRMAGGLLELLQGVQPVVGALDRHAGVRGHSVAVLVQRLSAGRPSFTAAGAQLDEAALARARIAGTVHAAAIASALQAMDRQLPGMRTLAHILMLLPDMLGARHPMTYMVVYQNSDELRATGGFMGSFGLITLRRGVASEAFRTSAVHDNLSIPPPEPVLYYNHEAAWLLRDSNWSPNFPTSAALERFFLRLDVHRTADAVVNVTPQAAADILGATGPVYSSEYRQTITAQNVANLADYYAHWAPLAGQNGQSTGTRSKQFIGVVARLILQRLGSLSSAQWLKLARSAAASSAHRDLLMNFRDPRAEALVRAAGAGGEMNPTRTDYVYVVDTNLSYNKINPYVHLSETYDTRIDRARWLHSTLTLKFHEDRIPAGLAETGIGPGAGSLAPRTSYASFVRVYVPAGAQLVDQRGWYQPWSPGPAYGKTMFSGYLIVPQGRSRTVTLQYVVPPNVFAPTRGASYRLLVPHQPGSHPVGVRITVRDDGGGQRGWLVAKPLQDWVGSWPIRQRPFAPIPLAATPRTVVAPRHWIEPHAFLGKPDPRGPFLPGG